MPKIKYQFVETCARQFRIDKWADQEFRPEVWIEKDALAGVIKPTCSRLDIPYIACKGYMSQSEMWVAGIRMRNHIKAGQTPVVFHLGDHDPSGKDMTRDIASRLEMFIGGRVKLDRLALNMDQVEEYDPPPNPAKQTDSRFAAYLEEFGDESWELDALEPTVLANLITEAVEGLLDPQAWKDAQKQERLHRGQLAAISANWEKLTRKLDVNPYLEDLEDEDDGE